MPMVLKSSLLLQSSLALLLSAALSACGPSDPLQALAEDYVQLSLQLSRFKDGEVDAWFGPAELAPAETDPVPTLADLQADAAALVAALAAEGELAATPRGQTLQAKFSHLVTVLDVLGASPLPPFNEEAQMLYGITVPETVDPGVQQRVFDELGALLPGQGTLAFRVASFRNKLLIPADRRKAVFERALAECRARTLQHWSLPAEEQLVLEWTRDVTTPWHRYEGGLRSTLQLNDLTLAFIGSAVDVACHEGYPGHHAQFVLYDTAAPEGLAVENTLVLLRSQEAALREGAANLGVDLVFPFAERLQFERDVLFPLAGLAPADAETNLRISQLLNELAVITLPIIRNYRDGIDTYNATTFELDREALVSSPGELLKFVDDYGAYSVGYTLARDRLAAHLQSTAGDPWATLAQLLQDPFVLP